IKAKFRCFLKIIGIDFKAKAKFHGRLYTSSLGCSYEVELTVPSAVYMFCFKPNIICCAKIDKEKVH
ncbi:hypothetical protein MTR67_006990, partial [Solanum verrucosum]